MSLTTVGARRLLKLADELESQEILKEKGLKFDMNLFFSRPEGAKLGDWCGTTCCAMGLACFVPSFRRAGLNVETCEDEVGSTTDVVFTDKETGEKFYNFEAAVKVFPGLSDAGAEYLFGAPLPNDETPKQVAKRIRRYVKENQS